MLVGGSIRLFTSSNRNRNLVFGCLRLKCFPLWTCSRFTGYLDYRYISIWLAPINTCCIIIGLRGPRSEYPMITLLTLSNDNSLFNWLHITYVIVGSTLYVHWGLGDGDRSSLSCLFSKKNSKVTVQKGLSFPWCS